MYVPYPDVLLLLASRLLLLLLLLLLYVLLLAEYCCWLSAWCPAVLTVPVHARYLATLPQCASVYLPYIEVGFTGLAFSPHPT
jgi:hypothetical protein